MSLDVYLKAAQTVAGEVRAKVPNSSNYAWTSSPVQSTQGLAPQPLLDQIGSVALSVTNFLGITSPSTQQSGVHQVSDQALGSLRGQFERTQPSNQSAWTRSFEEIKSTCYSYGYGNCGELAAIACLLLCEERTKWVMPCPIEYVQIWDGVTRNPVLPHLIAVIGRNPNQLVANNWPAGLPGSWHADSVICDPWDRVFYPAKDYNDFWGGLRSHSDAPNQLTCKVLCQL